VTGPEGQYSPLLFPTAGLLFVPVSPLPTPAAAAATAAAVGEGVKKTQGACILFTYTHTEAVVFSTFSPQTHFYIVSPFWVSM